MILKTENTKTEKNIIRVVGALFIIQMVTAVLSYSVILDPILFNKSFPADLAKNETKVIIAVLLDFTCGISVFGIAILLFPILKRFNERIALWYVGLRLNELVTLTLSGILLLTILAVSREYIKNDTQDTSFLFLLSKYLLNARGNTQDLSLIGYCFASIMFYYLLFTSKLVPRFLSIWGLIGVPLLFIEIVANIFNTSVGGMLIMMPIGLNEIFLGFWLIFKGFDENILYSKTI